MKVFLDTADLSEIEALAATGLVDGVTTNPSLVARSGRPYKTLLGEICATVPGPVSAEVTALDAATMVEEGRVLAGIAHNITVKVPVGEAGLKACATLREEGIMVNVTLCFNAAQALLAAKAQATFVSPFIGRLDDVGADGIGVMADMVRLFATHGLRSQVLASSLRHPEHVVAAARAGAQAATVPPAVMHQLFAHPLTDRGLDAFLADWAASGQQILDT